MSNPYDTATERRSILGPTLHFRGELSAEEDLVIQGRVEGSIRHTQRITVGQDGRVKADIYAQIIIVEGTVEGDLHATKSVMIRRTANLRGNVHAPAFTIVEGAVFNGHVSKESPKPGAWKTATESDSSRVRDSSRAAKQITAGG